MAFAFRELNEDVRKLMVEEIKDAINVGSLYYSKRFNENGREAWPGLLLQAAQDHDEVWLAGRLEGLFTMKQKEIRAKPKGGYTHADVPFTAEETLADAEFNRYYMCAICRKAIQDGTKEVTVYRAQGRGQPRPESQALIGQTYNPAELHVEIRKKPEGKSHALVQPNSGLSIHS